MIKAIDKFDPHRGVLFETYCIRRIHGEIIDDLRKKDWIPRLVRHRAQQLEKAAQKLQALLGRMPSDKELADEFDMNHEEFSHFQRDANALGLFSLHTALSEGDSDDELQEINLIADKKGQDPCQASLKKDIREFILKGFQIRH